MKHCEARRDARRDDSGNNVPLAEQDVSRWSMSTLIEAERLLSEAAKARRVGRFQLEAAIQSVHVQRARTNLTDWESIALLYEGGCEYRTDDRRAGESRSRRRGSSGRRGRVVFAARNPGRRREELSALLGVGRASA